MISSKASDNLFQGSLIKNIILYTIPIIATGLLQLAFNAADVIVVGRWAGETALAAVGSTGALIALIVNGFMGFSVGAAVNVAKYWGAKDDKGIEETVHTAMTTSIIAGIAVGIFGFLCSNTFLKWMGTPNDVINLSTLYMKIYFCGIPACMVYNFGAAILRSAGDTKNPLIFLSIAGVINVVLNLVFVIALKMSVAGVALATTISQTVSAILVVMFLMKVDGPHRFYLRKMHIYAEKLLQIIKVGLPAGIQGCIFSLSNVVIQSSVNSLGPPVMSGSAAAANIEGFVYTSMNSFHHASLTFIGQSVGAGRYDRIPKIARINLICVTLVGIITGGLVYVFREPLLSLYLDHEIENYAMIVSYGALRIRIICLTYFTCGIMDVMAGILRGMGYSVIPMIIALVGACGTRLIWIYTVFRKYRTFSSIFISYPISWILTIVAQIIAFVLVWNLIIKKKNSFVKIDEKAICTSKI